MKKIGISCIGLHLRGLFKDEMGQANSACLDSVVLKMLSDLYDAEFYLLKPLQLKSEEYLKSLIDSGDEYAKKFHMTYNEPYSNYPDQLDLIFIQQSNLALYCTTRYWEEIKNRSTQNIITQAMAGYHSINLYPKAKLLTICTDFLSPFISPQLSHNIINGLFPVQDHRKCHIFQYGVNTGDKVVDCGHISHSLKCNQIHPFDVDFQFIIELNERNDLKVIENPIGISFAGKDRSQGSRAPILKSIIEKQTVPVHMIGRWRASPKSKVNRDERNEYWDKYSEKCIAEYQYWKHPEVIEDYNKWGFTLYASCQMYRNKCTITSRFSDALIAKCIPLIWYEEADTLKKYYPESIIDELTVNLDNIEQVIDNLSKDYQKRVDIINMLTECYKKNHQIAIDQMRNYITGIMNGEYDDPAFNYTKEDFEEDVKSWGELVNSKTLHQNKIENGIYKQQADLAYKYRNMTFDEIIANDPYQAKIASGVYYQSRNRESWDDVRPDYKQYLDNILSAIPKE